MRVLMVNKEQELCIMTIPDGVNWHLIVKSRPDDKMAAGQAGNRPANTVDDRVTYERLEVFRWNLLRTEEQILVFEEK